MSRDTPTEPAAIPSESATRPAAGPPPGLPADTDRTFRYQRPTVTLIALQTAPENRPVGVASAVFEVTPTLPRGMQIDASSGAISGVPASGETNAGFIYRITAVESGGRRRFASVWMEVIEEPGRAGGHRFLATTGDDANPGTLARPFRTFARALKGLVAGDTLFVRGGAYVEYVDIAALVGEEGRPITIRAYPGERVFVDGSLAEYRQPNNTDWERVVERGAHPDEFRSTRTYDVADDDYVNRVALLGGDRYVRLATYSAIDDLRAANETLAWIAMDDPRPGPVAVQPPDPTKPRRPWTYFGPGIWWNRATRRVHARLSHTHVDLPGVEDYRGETDPRKVALAVTPRSATTLVIRGSRHLVLKHLTLRFGGDNTAHITSSSDVTFDHVDVLAATDGIRLGENAVRFRFLHGVYDGGIPPWTFREDYKADYDYWSVQEGARVMVANGVVRKTQQTLFLMLGNATDTEIAFNEFRNGHDLYVGGIRTRMHHNWMHEIIDEGLFISHSPLIEDLRISENVVDTNLSALSFAGGRRGVSRFIYRNLIDLRTPTRGFRRDTPDPRAPHSPWRFGHVFKYTAPVGPFNVYQNTILVAGGYGQSAIDSFNALPTTLAAPADRRWILNNIFVAFMAEPDNQSSLTVYPSPAQARVTDSTGQPAYRSVGNLWDLVGSSSSPLWRCITRVPGDTCALRSAATLDELRAHPTYAALEWEAMSTRARAGFVRLDGDALARATDDFRPGPTSSARNRGALLPPDWPDPYRPPAGTRPDIGAFTQGHAPLGVGPNGGRYY